jgi:nanoRNase/pAp phosphatase (c-di-AMP/oligoRNAs hydrolase)
MYLYMMPQGVGKAELSHCGGRARQPEVRQEAAEERGGGRREAAGLTPRSITFTFTMG